MGTRILLLTNNYPISGVNLYGSTSVCHYFAKEWVARGIDVRVVFYYTVYTPLFHFLGRMFGEKISNIFPTTINSVRFKNEFEYQIDGVRVLLVPCYKFCPKIPFPKSSVLSVVDSIHNYLVREEFDPTIVTAHFLQPSLEILTCLKKYYSIPMGVVLHGKITKSYDVSRIIANKSNIDFWGFRNLSIKKAFENFCFAPQKEFLCYSGVPESYINPLAYVKHTYLGLKNILFVGNLIKRKHPVAIIEALAQIPHEDVIVNYIGSGPEKREIQKVAKKNGLTSNVKLKGRLNRREVIKEMQDAECFVMISRDETFGLVYLEAMAKGCIVVASRNEGMDGIIIDGINGFLCEAGNYQELSCILSKINALTIDEKSRISQMAIKSAQKYTDSMQASEYLDFLSQLDKCND